MSGPSSAVEEPAAVAAASPLPETTAAVEKEEEEAEEIAKDRLITATVVQMLEESPSSRRSYLRGYGDVVVTLVACLGAVSVGMAAGYSSPALEDPELTRLLGGTDRRTWFASLMAIGAIFGGPCAGFLVEAVGRKLTLMTCTLPMGAGWFLITVGVDFVVLYVGRILCGFAMGMAALAAPLYVAETASRARRGVLGAGFQLSVSAGILAVYGMGIPLGWSWLAVACMSVSSLNVLLLLIVPESPRWYAAQRRRLEAMESLAWLADERADVREEYAEMERIVRSQSSKGSFSVRELILPANYRPALISFGMMFFQQMSGINIVIFYSNHIFATAGYADDPKTPTIIIGSVLVAATAASCVLIDRAGRRILLLVSGVATTLSITALGVHYYLALVRGYGIDWLPLTSVLVYVAFFSLGWGPVPWIVMSEIVPTRTRGFVNGLATSFAWIIMFVVTKEFESLGRALGLYGAFWFFGGFCLLSCVFVGLLVPETKGRTLEEIQGLFAKNSSDRQKEP